MPKKTSLPRVYWIITAPETDSVYHWTLATTRRDAIWKAERQWTTSSWEQMRRQGCRATKVTLNFDTPKP